MSASTTLAPCPFCGNVTILKRSTVGDYTSIVCQATCAGPLVIVIPNDRMAEGIAAWNRRAPAPASSEPVAAQNQSNLSDNDACCAPVMPKCWQAVPVQPTDAMLCALMQWDGESGASILPEYRSMLAAAPRPQAPDHFVSANKLVAADHSPDAGNMVAQKGSA